jgi:hypothetical protein
MTTLIIDLHTGAAEILPEEEFKPATQGLQKIETDVAITYRGEEYMVVVLK